MLSGRLIPLVLLINIASKYDKFYLYYKNQYLATTLLAYLQFYSADEFSLLSLFTRLFPHRKFRYVLFILFTKIFD